MIDVAEINDLDRLCSFRLLWDDLWAQTPDASFVQSFSWFRSYCETFGYEDRLRTLVVSLAGKPIGIVPLVVKTVSTSLGQLRVLTYPAGWDAGKYGPVARHTTAVLLAAVQHLQDTRRNWDVLAIGPASGVAEESRIANAFRTAGVKSYRTPTADVGCVRCDTAWDDYWAERPVSLQRDVETWERRFANLRYVRVRPGGVSNGDTDRRWSLYRHFEQLQEMCDVPSLPYLGLADHFLRNVHPAAVDAGSADLNVLFRGDHAVAAAYNYANAGFVECIGFRVARDSERDFSSLLMARMLHDCFERGYHSISLQRVPREFAKDWQNGTSTTVRYSHFATLAPRAQLLRLGGLFSGRLRASVPAFNRA